MNGISDVLNGSSDVLSDVASFNSGQGHIMVSIMTDLHDFWTYENREVIVTDAKEGSESLGLFPPEWPHPVHTPPDVSTLCHKPVGPIDPVRFSFPSPSFVYFL